MGSRDGQAWWKQGSVGLLEFSSFRVGSGAQFAQIHALSFALESDPMWVEAVENPIEQVGQRPPPSSTRRSWISQDQEESVETAKDVFW